MNQNENYEQTYKVTPLELFFDLIYALALSQVTEFIMSDISWLTIIKAIILLGAIYMIWSYTSWAATIIPATEAKSSRMIVVVMVFGFFMNASIEHAFDSKGYIFVEIYLAIQFGRIIWTMVHSPNEVFRGHFKQVLIWQMISAPFWFVGIFYSNIIQVVLWSIGIFIDLLGTWTAHPILNKKALSDQEVYFDDEHMLERCRLFRIIALGEMVFSVGDALKETHLNLMMIILGCISMAEIVSLWMLTFGRFFKLVSKYRENNKNPVLVSRYAINVLVVILVGIVFITVGNKYILLHPYERAPMIIVCVLGSGPLMFLLAQGWYLHKIPRIHLTLYIVSGFAIVISNIVGLYVQAWIYHIALGCILMLVSYIDFRKIE